MNWPPIETAPRDGTEVLIYDGTDKIVVYYSEMYGCFMDRHGDRYEPIVWHPLPPAPTASQSLTIPLDEELDSICAAARARAYSCAKAEAEAALAQLPMDDDLDEPLGPACSRENQECESCQ